MSKNIDFCVILIYGSDSMLEKAVHQLIIDSENIKRDLANILNIEYETMELVHEDQYINLMYADFTVLSCGKVRAIIEVKGGNINVTDYVRGIGQLYQYEYYKENKAAGKEYCEDFNVIYIFPQEVLQNNYFNIGTFKYPNSTMIIELNTETQIIRKIDSNELKHLANAQRNNLVSISQYYIRDNRFFELYLLLQYLMYLKVIGEKDLNRRTIENEFLIKLETPNNRNWRNAFISLSSLGLIDDNNCVTYSGVLMAVKPYEEFLLSIYNSYIKVYIQELFECFDNKTEINITNQEIKDKIYKKWNNRDVLFLTESNGRYISSWLNIMRDDFGIISFDSRQNFRKINYNPLILNDNELLKLIKENSMAYQYLERYYDILRGDF